MSLFVKGEIIVNKAIGTHIFPPEGGHIEFSENGTILGVDVKDENYIVMDVTNLTPVCVSILWKFWDNNDPNEAESIKMGILPNLRTRLALPVSAVRGNTLFLKRTPGKLKTVVQGRPVVPDEIVKFAVGVDRAPTQTQIIIHELFISTKAPDFPVPAGALVDSLGQKKNAVWKGKTNSFEELAAYLNEELSLPRPAAANGCGKYGGTLKKRFEPTGFFALHNENGVFWLADPEGYAFFSNGADCVGVGGDCNIEGIHSLCGDISPEGKLDKEFYSWSVANLKKVFGEKWYDAWSSVTARRLREWGTNTVACWSDRRFIESSDMPYVHILNGFPRTEKYIFRDFPDVFDPNYALESEKWARQLSPLADDPFMIGYFMCNEPMWAFVNELDIAKMTLESSDSFYSKTRLTDILKNKYEAIEKLNSVWGTDFADFDELRRGGYRLSEASKADTQMLSAEMIREFVRVPALALRKSDPNHLNLGMRYAWLSSAALAAGKEYFDVFSFNCYRHDPLPSIERMVEMVQMPVMIGEFHFGATDRGLDATGIQAVANQTDRAKAYRYYMHRCASHPYCLGAHYFQYADQSYLGRFDGENYQIGMVDVCHRPYEEFIQGVTQANSEVYDVRMGITSVTDDIPAEVESIFY